MRIKLRRAGYLILDKEFPEIRLKSRAPDAIIYQTVVFVRDKDCDEDNILDYYIADTMTIREW